MDLISSIPFDYILMLTNIDNIYIRYVRILRLFKAYRVHELAHLLRKNTRINVPLYRIIMLALILAVLAHWANCILILISVIELDNHSRFDGKTLLDYMTHHPYSAIKDAHKMTDWDLYFNLLVTSVSFMDFGDIVPFTIAEEIFSLIHISIGRVFISFIFAEVASYVSS